MKTLTSPTARTVTRIVVACLFSTGVALCDTLNSSLRYGVELESKQTNLKTIKEDAISIEEMLNKKVDEMRRKKKKVQARLDGLDFVGHDIAAILPAAPRPALQMQISPHGTLTPRGNTAVINRGWDTGEEGK